ncbi:MAG: sensor domain-containing diguanylate cyclase [Spirochaetales bacterium]|nr:sensor domain-containing diguanylate cyclase [Spirochaetales bacterium]
MNISAVVFYSLVISCTILLISTLFLIFRDISRNRTLKQTLAEREKLELLNKSMLDITQSIVGIENPEDLYKLILAKVIAFIPNACVGSVLVKNDAGLFECAVQQGFDEEKIRDFKIPLEETILWKYSGGKIIQSEIIDDVSLIEDLELIPLAEDSDEWHIRSTIAVPLILNGQVEGILHIDNRDPKAFSSEDLQSMEYIRSNLEIALQKFQLYRNMVHLSRFDSLTKAYNRNYFMEQFENILNRAVRYGENFSLLIFDIDNLKIVNDSFGHLTGDQVLKVFSETTRIKIRKTDTFARWGGDEFLVVFYNISEGEIAEKISEIRLALNETPVQTSAESVTVSFSYGHAFFPLEGETFDQLLKTADNRMYVNKRKNRKPPLSED